MLINFGCGTNCSDGWCGYDASPTLQLQRLPIVGRIFQRCIKPKFDSNIKYGDIRRGLGLPPSSAEMVYCSHVLEHFSLNDMRLVLKQVHALLKPGGIFRGVLPDLAAYTKAYLDSADAAACSDFMRASFLGLESRPRGINSLLRHALGNSNHLWMWDFKGLKFELENSGFRDVRTVFFGDSEYSEFKQVEDCGRWMDGFGFECKK